MELGSCGGSSHGTLNLRMKSVSNLQLNVDVKETLSTDKIPSYETNVSSKCKRMTYLMTLTVFSCLGSILFGYGTGIVSGAMIKVNEVFDLSDFWHGLIVSVTVGAAAVASLIGGPFSEILGRKIVLISSAVVFTVGAILLSASGSKEVLLVGRIVVGLGVGKCVFGRMYNVGCNSTLLHWFFFSQCECIVFV